MKYKAAFFSISLLGMAACATTDIQPLTASSFMVATEAAPACQRSGARKLANKAAAIEVIKRGGDEFVFLGQNVGSRHIGGGFSRNSYDAYHTNEQDLVVQMLGSGENPDALSARQLLGPDWAEVVRKGVPKTCT